MIFYYIFVSTTMKNGFSAIKQKVWNRIK